MWNRASWVAVASASLVVAGCMSSSVSPETVQAKAASDLSCPAQTVKVEQINDGNWKAAGCGKQVSYVCSGSNFMTSGMCMREGELPR